MDKLTDWIKVYDDLMAPETVDACLLYFATSPKGKHEQDWRRCQEVTTLDSSHLWLTMRDLIRRAYQQYRNDCGNSVLNFANTVEAPNIFCYYHNSDQPNYFNVHADAWNFPTASRQVSIIIYLNDVEVGGETTFTNLGMSVRPKRGRILLFPSTFTYLHSGDPPKSNDKYIIVTWIHFDGEGHAYRCHRL